MQNLQEATDFVIIRASLSETDRVRVISDLEITAGIDTLTRTIYRPYYLIGKELWLSTDNNLKKAEGAEFDQNFETARRYLSQQLIIDNQLKLTIPDEFKASYLLSMVNPISQPSVASSIGFLSF